MSYLVGLQSLPHRLWTKVLILYRIFTIDGLLWPVGWNEHGWKIAERMDHEPQSS
jgi:hypothetical protein